MGRNFKDRVSSRLIRIDLDRAESAGQAARRSRQLRRLHATADYARRRSPLYADLYEGISRGRFPLNELPVVSKQLLMDRFDDWVTDPAVTITDVRAFVADKSTIGEPYLGRYLVSQTAGSSGFKAVIVRDRDALRRQNLLMEQRLRWSGGTTGGPGKRTAIAYVAKMDGHTALYAGWKYSQQAPRRQGTPEERFFSIQAPMGRLVAELNEYQPTILNSNPSMLGQLAERQAAGELAIQLGAIVSGGETLTPGGSGALTRAFGCPVHNLYASTEFKFIAFGCDRGWLHVNEDWVILEPIDRDRLPVPPGVTSDSVLLTDLINRSQPLIRYELDDRITVKPEPCECGRTLSAVKVEGRSRTIMRFTSSEGATMMLHPSVVEWLFHDRPAILRYQIVVGRSNMRIRLLLDGAEGEGVWGGLVADVRQRLSEHGLDFVTVERDSRPPEIDPDTGKTRQIITEGA